MMGVGQKPGFRADLDDWFPLGLVPPEAGAHRIEEPLSLGDIEG